MKKLTMENYKEMRGVEFTCYIERDNPSGSITTCFVADVDKDIGITIKDLNSSDPTDYLYCYNVKNALRSSKRKSTVSAAVLTRMNRLNALIQSGEVFYLFDLIPEKSYAAANSPGFATCGFS
jgi:hypothetical protein